MALSANGQKVIYNAAIIAAAVMLLLTIIFNGLASAGPSVRIFMSNTGNISDKYPTEITPAGWTFSIWGFIYVWQILWIGYAVSTIFRKTHREDLFPTMLPIWLYIAYILNMMFNISWLFIWDAESLAAAFVVLALIAFTLYICLFFAHRGVTQCLSDLELKNRKELWLARMLVQNGLACYATWTTIATLLNFVIFLQYSAHVPLHIQETSVIALAILTAEIVLYFVFENFLFWKQLTFTFSPWIVVIVALSGVLSKHWTSPPGQNAIYVLVLLIGALVLVVVKVSIALFRFCHRKSTQSKPLSLH